MKNLCLIGTLNTRKSYEDYYVGKSFLAQIFPFVQQGLLQQS